MKKKDTKPSNRNDKKRKKNSKLTLKITMDRRLFIKRVQNRFQYDKCYQYIKHEPAKKETNSTALLKLICGIKHVIQTTEPATTKMSIC